MADTLGSFEQAVLLAILLVVGQDVFNTFRAPSGASYLDALSALARLPLSPFMGFCVLGLAGAPDSVCSSAVTKPSGVCCVSDRFRTEQDDE